MNQYAFIIGYRNHAERVAREVVDSKAFKKIYVYHPKIKKKK